MQSEPLYAALADISARRSAWKDFSLAEDARSAPTFNVFDLLPLKELGLSQVLRWMLDPRGSHGQADAFLKLFKTHFEIKQEFSTSCAVAQVEVATHRIEASNRRIDVHVRCGNFLLAIENKPFAGWQASQIEDYLDHLSKDATDHVLVLLKGAAGEAPAEQFTKLARADLIANDRLIDADYSMLIDWVEACELASLAPRVRDALYDFSRHLRETFLGGGNVTEDRFVLQSLRSHPDRLVAAMDLIDARDTLFSMILGDLVAAVAAASSEFDWTISTKRPPNQNMDTHARPLFLDFGPQTNLLFAFVTHTNTQQPYFGVKWKSASVKRANGKIYDHLNAAIPGDSWDDDDWWPWFTYPTGEEFGIGDPKRLGDVWAMISDSKAFANVVIAKANEVRAELTKLSV